MGDRMTLFEFVLLIIVAFIGIIIMLIIKYKFKNSDFNHIEALYYLEKTEIPIDRFTAHRMKFATIENKKIYKNTELIYNHNTNGYTLIIHHFSEEHKEETLKRINSTILH